MLLHDLADIFLQVSLRPGEFQLIILGLKILSLNLNKKLKSQYYELWLSKFIQELYVFLSESHWLLYFCAFQ